MKDKDLLGKMRVDFIRDLPSEINELKKDLVLLRDGEAISSEESGVGSQGKRHRGTEENRKKEAAERIKRRAHSIKSCASFFPDLSRMRDIAYKMEILFLMIENGRLEPDQEILRLTEDAGEVIIKLGNGEDIDLKDIEVLFDGFMPRVN